MLPITPLRCEGVKNIMKFSQLFPVAFAIALIASIYVLAAQYFQISAVWLPFISWALYFIVGGKPSYLSKEILCLTGGMIFAFVTLVMVGPISGLVGKIFAMPVTVFIAAFLILILELFKPLDMIPAYFFSYTSFFAYYYGGFGGEGATPLGIMPLYWTLLMVGLGLGYFTSEIRNKILRMKRK